MNFIKSTIFSGLLVLFPLLLLWLGLVEIAGLLMALVDPIVLLFPEGFFDEAYLPGVLAGLLLLIFAFLVGLASRSSLAQRMGAAIERRVLGPLPMYRMLKSISEAFLDADSSNFRPALVTAEDGSAEPCYVVEAYADGLAAVVLPWSPTSFAGSVKIVPQRSLRQLDCSLDEFSRSLSLMGVGLGDCLRDGAGKELAASQAPGRT